jgi:hypothetical protein
MPLLSTLYEPLSKQLISVLGAPRCPLGEAPASVNVRVMLAGHECQLTLRDHDEGALLLRLQAVLKRPDVQPVPRPAPRAGQWKKRAYAGR